MGKAPGSRVTVTLRLVFGGTIISLNSFHRLVSIKSEYDHEMSQSQTSPQRTETEPAHNEKLQPALSSPVK